MECALRCASGLERQASSSRDLQWFHQRHGSADLDIGAALRRALPASMLGLSQFRLGFLAGKALREVCSKSMDGILSQEATVARHALALACHLAQHNAPQLLDAHSDLATVVAATCGIYEASGEPAPRLIFIIPCLLAYCFP